MRNIKDIDPDEIPGPETRNRETFLSEELDRFLNRKSVPDRIKNSENYKLARRDELDALLGLILRYAPHRDWVAWWNDFISIVGETAETAGWPTEGVLSRAAQQVRNWRNATYAQTSSGDPEDRRAEDNAVIMLGDWFDKFRNKGRGQAQMPSMGSPARTAALIRSGILANEREAKFYGFDLGPDQMRRARDQDMGSAEWRHHVKVCARLWHMEDDWHRAEARAMAEMQTGRPIPPSQYVKRMTAGRLDDWPDDPDQARDGGEVAGPLIEDTSGPVPWYRDPDHPEHKARLRALGRGGRSPHQPTDDHHDQPHDEPDHP